MSLKPSSDLPSKIFYSLRAIMLTTFLCGPIAGGYMIAQNFKVLGKFNHSRVSMYSSIGFTILLFIAIISTPDKIIEKFPTSTLPVLYTLIISLIAKNNFKRRFEELGETNIHFHNGFRVFKVGLVSLFVSIIFALVTIFFVDVEQEDLSILYQTEYIEYEKNEEAALKYFSLFSTETDEVIKKEIEEVAIPKWAENQRIINSVANSETLPEEYIEEVEKLKQYTNLRLEQAKLFAKYFKDYDSVNEQLLYEIDSKIERTIN